MSDVNNKTGRETCYICGSANSDVLETHHIVPRRFGGGDSAENLVDLCPSCHATLEKLYNKRFYDELGVEKEGDDVSGYCYHGDCWADATKTVDGAKVYQSCDEHFTCSFGRCSKNPVQVISQRHDDLTFPVCEQHRKCDHTDCESTNTEVVLYMKFDTERYATYCSFHDPDGYLVEYPIATEDSTEVSCDD